MRTATFLIASLILGGTFAVPARADDKADAKTIHALLVCGGCCHDYARQKEILSKGLAEHANVAVTIAYDPNSSTSHVNPVYEKEDWFKDFDVIIHDECSADVKDLAVIDRVLKPHKDGLPAVVLHCGMHCYRSDPYPKTTAWMEFTGMNTNHHGAQLPIAITFTDKQSPITKGMDDWTTIKEELYHQEELLPTAKALATGKQKESDTVIWTNLYNGKAKVFSTTLGHNNQTVADARYLELVARGLLWSTGHLTDDGKPAPGYEGKK